jgi:hypothetical protein
LPSACSPTASVLLDGVLDVGIADAMAARRAIDLHVAKIVSRNPAPGPAIDHMEGRSDDDRQI